MPTNVGVTELLAPLSLVCVAIIIAAWAYFRTKLLELQRSVCDPHFETVELIAAVIRQQQSNTNLEIIRDKDFSPTLVQDTLFMPADVAYNYSIGSLGASLLELGKSRSGGLLGLLSGLSRFSSFWGIWLGLLLLGAQTFSHSQLAATAPWAQDLPATTIVLAAAMFRFIALIADALVGLRYQSLVRATPLGEEDQQALQEYINLFFRSRALDIVSLWLGILKFFNPLSILEAKSSQTSA
jgi:hypothetical protein